MTALVIPASRLEELRRIRGQVEYRQRYCLCCSRLFRSVGAMNTVCGRCRCEQKTTHWEFRT